MAPLPYALRAHERAEAVLRACITDSHQRGDAFVFIGKCHTNGHGVAWIRGGRLEVKFYPCETGARFAFQNAKRAGR